MKKRKPKTPKDPIRKKNGKIRLHALTLEEDLKYRGPLHRPSHEPVDDEF